MRLGLEDIGFSYDRGLPTETALFESLSLEVSAGEFLSVVGRTGSGKTTLGLIMAGLLQPDSGTVRRECKAGPLRVSMVFQLPESQFFHDDVFGEVAFGPRRAGVVGPKLERAVSSSLLRAGLEPREFMRRSTDTLSEGEKRKVAIASALSCRPDVVVLDEPSISLDWEAAAQLFSALAKLRDAGTSVVVMSHDVENACLYSDRVAVLVGGMMVAQG
ncbi:MAG: ABC transporter ATP-binding protein, partial [Candidatus Eisenbacteria bacterium]